MTRTAPAALALVVVLAGCGTEAPEGLSDVTPAPATTASSAPTPDTSTRTDDESTSTSPPSPSSSPMPDATTAADGAVLDDTLTFEQAGGLVPLERLDIEPDGRATLTSGGQEPVEFTVPADTLAAIADEATVLADEEADQMADPPVPDATNWGFLYGQADVVADEPGVSDRLRPLVERLQGLLEEHRPTS